MAKTRDTIYDGKGQSYPDNPNITNRRAKVAGIEGTMITRDPEGPWDEDDIASGPGQATERMGAVMGAADTSPSIGLRKMSSGSRRLSNVDNNTHSLRLPEHRMATVRSKKR